MKKNKMMRVASFLLVAVLLSTSVISGTFAKYVSEDSAGDNARVAKWGVELQVAGVLYGDHYDAGTVAPTAYTDANAATVTADAQGTKVVAPGTKNDSGLTFKLTGTPEVSGTITTVIEYENIYLKAGEYGVMIELGTVSESAYTAMMAAANDTDKLYVKDGSNYKLATAFDAGTTYYTLEDYANVAADYYPVIYALAGGTTSYSAGAITADSLANAVATLNAKLGTPSTTVADGKTTATYTTNFTPNQNLATVLGIDDETITWQWAFEQSQDGADTILGDLQAGITVVKNNGGTWSAPEAATGTDAKDYNLETAFSVTITATQVD